MALIDRAGVYGAARFHGAMRKLGLRSIVGAEIPLEDDTRLPVLVEARAGYRNLCRLLTRMHLRAPKGEGTCRLEELEEFADGLVCLTGGDNGPLSRLRDDREALGILERLIAWFGRESVFVEISRHHLEAQERHTRHLLGWANTAGLPVVATNAANYATREEKQIADVFACLRHHVRLDAAGRRLEPNTERCLKSPAEMAKLFRDLPHAVARTGELAERLTFQLSDLGYEFPRAPVRPGDLVAVDTLDLRPLPGLVLKQFTARDIVSRWDVLEVRSRATSTTATEFLSILQARMPFPIRAVQVDGGSEFAAEFEYACQQLGLRLFVLPPRSPKLNGHVERANRTHTEEFHEVIPTDWSLPALNCELRRWERIYNTVRPHQALGDSTPLEFLQELQRSASLKGPEL